VYLALTGVVSARDQRSIQVAVNEWPNVERLRLDLTPDEMTRRRQLSAMRKAAAARGRLAQLRAIILQQREPKYGQVPEVRFVTELNPSQQEAVRFALSAEDLAIIHGPPGTGKTTTVVELILQLVQRGKRVLACAPSNTAVDNLLERLVTQRAEVVRIGHPARVAKDLRDYTLDALIEQHPLMTHAKQLQREAEKLQRQAEKYTRAAPERGAKKAQRFEARELRYEAQQMEQQIADAIVSRAKVICATTSFDDSVLGDEPFDVVVIDEACQCTEPACWLPILRAETLVLAGDHFQLPPTVLSAQAAAEGMEVSLLERLAIAYGQQVQRRLTVQYRMHEDIMQFSSQAFYDGDLTADASVRRHVLADLPQLSPTDFTLSPLAFFDTAGTGWEEEIEEDGESKLNPQEARYVLKKIDQLCELGLDPSDIALIAPYAAQVRWLRDQCRLPDLEIDTVDGFQGREKEAVVISTVRSNGTGEIGFLGDTRRMNVALTRAKRKLILVGDSATLAHHPFYASLLQYFEGHGAYRSVWEDAYD
jgi:superfamily I DNA and/or RNA helicase